jgi:hypothetical protein
MCLVLYRQAHVPIRRTYGTYRKQMKLAVEDESIFIHDALIRRRMWTPEGKRPIVTVTGSHQKTCVFGTITIDGKQLFQLSV